MASKVLRFGGEHLPPSTHTFYERTDKEGEFRAEFGHEVDADVVKHADTFIQNKQASMVSAGKPAKDASV